MHGDLGDHGGRSAGEVISLTWEHLEALPKGADERCWGDPRVAHPAEGATLVNSKPAEDKQTVIILNPYSTISSVIRAECCLLSPFFLSSSVLTKHLVFLHLAGVGAPSSSPYLCCCYSSYPQTGGDNTFGQVSDCLFQVLVVFCLLVWA